MKRMASVWIGLCAGLLLAGAAYAEDTRSGQVVEKSSLMNTITIVTEDGERLTYGTGEATEVERDGQAVGLDAVAKGTQVKVTSPAEPTQGEQAQASRIELQADVAAPPPGRP